MVATDHAHFQISPTLHPGALTILEENLKRFQDQDYIVLGGLNNDIGQSQNPCIQKVSDMMIEFRLMGLIHHFQPLWRFHHMKTWYQVRQRRMLWARCDYILGTDWRQFKVAVIRDVRNYPSNCPTLQTRLLIYPTEAGHQCGARVLLSQI